MCAAAPDAPPGMARPARPPATSAPTMPSASFRMTLRPPSDSCLTCSQDLAPTSVNEGRRPPGTRQRAPACPNHGRRRWLASGGARRRRSGRARPGTLRRQGRAHGPVPHLPAGRAPVPARPPSWRGRGPGRTHVARRRPQPRHLLRRRGRLPAMAVHDRPPPPAGRAASPRATTRGHEAGALPEQEVLGDEFQVHDDLDRALALVRRLPPDQADAVLLRIVAGMDVGQVAELMGRSEGSVRVLVHRGLHAASRPGQPGHVDVGVTAAGALAMKATR